MSKSNAWKPGQSSNPKGRPIDPGRKEALAILKEVAPAPETFDLQRLAKYHRSQNDRPGVHQRPCEHYTILPRTVSLRGVSPMKGSKGKVALLFLSVLLSVLLFTAKGQTQNLNYSYGGSRQYLDDFETKANTRFSQEYWVGVPWLGDTLQKSLTFLESLPFSPPCKLHINAPQTVTANLTIPANITLAPNPGAILSIDTGVTLTINGPFEAGRYQVFSCTGTGQVVFGSALTDYPEWWGAKADGGTTDNTPPINAALNALAYGGKVSLVNGSYYLNTYTTISTGPPYGVYQAITWPTVGGIELAGQGEGDSVIVVNFGENYAGSTLNNYYDGIVVNNSSTASVLQGLWMHDFSIKGLADQAAVPTTLIMLGSNLFDINIERVECCWAAQAGIRLNNNPIIPGGRQTIQHCYLHDICDSNCGYTGGGGAILGIAPHSKYIFNIFVNCGNNSLFHSIYASTQSGGYFDISHNDITANYPTVTAGDLSLYSDGYPMYGVTVNDNRLTNSFLEISDIAGGTFNNNSFYNSIMEIKYDVTGYNAVGNSFNCPTLATYYVVLAGTNGHVSDTQITGAGTSAAIGYYLSLTGTSDITISGGKVTNCYEMGYVDGPVSDITFKGVEFSGISTGSYPCGLLVTGASGTASNIQSIGCYYKNTPWLATLYSGVGSFYGENNRVLGVTGLLQNYMQPSVNVMLKDTMVLDTSLTTPFYGYGTAYAPTASNPYSIINTRQLSTPTVTLANCATPKVWIGTDFLTGGTTAITNLQGGCVGQTINVQAAGSVTLDHNANFNDGNMQLSGETNFAMIAGNTITFHMFVQGVWEEMNRKI